MPEFQKIGKASDIQPGEGQSYTVEDYIIGVFNVDGEFHAINDLCPHMGASLSAGHLDGCAVACPWHAWRFDVKEGTWCDNTRLKIETFEVRVEGDDLLVSTTPRPEEEEKPKKEATSKENDSSEGNSAEETK